MDEKRNDEKKSVRINLYKAGSLYGTVSLKEIMDGEMKWKGEKEK